MPLRRHQQVGLCVAAVLLTAFAVLVTQTLVLGVGRGAADIGQVPDLRGSTDKQIASLQAWLRQYEHDPSRQREVARATVDLGSAYLQKARESGDPAYYPRAEAAFQQALAADPNDFRALAGLGALALSRHQFQQALSFGEQARAIAPESVAVLGVVADAQTELGQYDAAAATIQQMVDLRPDLASYARVSYARELHGYLPEAIEAMRRAAEAGPPGQEGTAWTRVQLGNLYFNTGNLTAAQEAYQQALHEVPDYLHALAGLARVEGARGHYQAAIELYRKATAAIPIPEYIIALGDVYQATEAHEQAEQQYALVDTIERLYAANGVDLDLEIALFDLDHDRRLPQALEQARMQAQRRPSIKAQDVLAWALYKNGDCQAAQQAMSQALRLGTKDALLFFHAGLIADCLGQRDQARSYLEQTLQLNPAFSPLYASRARETLARLGGSSAATNRSLGGAS